MKHFKVNEKDTINSEKLKRKWIKQINNIELTNKAVANYQFNDGLIDHDADLAWQNGTLQLMEFVSMDYLTGKSIQNRCFTTLGQMNALSESRDFKSTYVMNKPQKKELHKKYDSAKTLIRRQKNTRTILEEDSEIEKFFATIEYEAKPGAFK